MIKHPNFVTEPWGLRSVGLDLSVLAQTESLFALSNGNIGWRGNLDEGEPHGIPGSYLNGFFESHNLPYAEAGYGYPESGQTMLNITNGKLIRLHVNDEPFDVRVGELRSHEQRLDFRTGLLQRSVEWMSPTGARVRIHSTRLVSLVRRSIAALCYEVEVLDEAARIVVQSELVANEPLPSPETDPRTSRALASPLVGTANSADGTRVTLSHSTSRSNMALSVSMHHTIEGPAGTHSTSESSPDLGRTTVSATLAPGQRLRLVKVVAFGSSDSRTLPAVQGQADAALGEAMDARWEGLIAEQHEYLDEFWRRNDVRIDGEGRLQQGIRFALFQMLQAGARAEGVAIPAKGLTGPGYDGHAFWDTEIFVLAALSYLVPDAAANALRWRHSTLPAALARAKQLGLQGAAFPWRTINGEECSGYWPAGVAAFHVDADIADAALRHVRATSDVEFERTIGLDLLVHTARLWRSLGHVDLLGRFCIDGVTGPDEYSAIADNNVYTNLMAQRNLAAAADMVERYPGESAALEVTSDESAAWRSLAAAVYIPFDETLGVHPQSEGFTRHERWDFEHTDADRYPLFLHFHYFDLYRKQVVKQADLVLAMYLRSDAFTHSQKVANFAYYETLTVRDSSLSACVQAVIAAEVGQLELAHDYLFESAFLDLDDIENNTRDGLHTASLAGIWMVIVAGYGGMRHDESALRFAPRLPAGLTRVRFGLILDDRTLRVEFTRARASYTLVEGESLRLLHYGHPVELTTAIPVRRSIPPGEVAGRVPSQPLHRSPRR